MNRNEIARAILERRNRMNPVIMTGEMTATLGYEGMTEALQRRWLVPNTETGHLQVSTDLRVVEEMRALAEHDPEGDEEDKKKPKHEPGCECGECMDTYKKYSYGLHKPMKEVGESHDLVMSHSSRTRGQLTELMAPGTGHDNSAPFRPPQPATPMQSTAPAPAPNGQPGQPGVGDEVLVAENGKTYTGTVGAVGQDGKYRVSFGNEKPPINRDYGTNEIKVTKKAAA